MRFPDNGILLSENEAFEPVIADHAAPEGVVEIKDKAFFG